MAGNTFGQLFTLTTFGESHGPALGGIIDGCPAGVTIDEDVIQADLDRRKPGQSKIVTQRKEPDSVEIYSGVFEGMTTGTPIGFLIHNSNQKSKDYDHIKNSYRPSHADYVYDKKYGFRDYRGGGRSSARETVARVVAGSIAKQFMSGVRFHAFVSAVGDLKLENPHLIDDFSSIELNPVRCPDPEMAGKMEDYIKKIRKDGDTVGGVITCVIKNVPIGLGEPVFDKFHAELGKATSRINRDTFPDNDTTIATTAAINDRIIDIVNDVGGFDIVESEQHFPNTNPQGQAGSAAVLSIKAASTNLVLVVQQLL
ncbi:MAG: hypothetical protein CM15mP59_5620 [Flavobacteriaceae bacterium]|nr:MAG: hypothetical protein CM15mP59_5620 [Flavobacteriaceae bacterium]